MDRQFVELTIELVCLSYQRTDELNRLSSTAPAHTHSYDTNTMGQGDQDA